MEELTAASAASVAAAVRHDELFKCLLLRRERERESVRESKSRGNRNREREG